MMSSTALRDLDEIRIETISNFVQPAEDVSFYHCIRCHSEFEESQENGLHCGVCGAFFPSIQDVKIFVSNPAQLLRKHVEWLPEKRQELAKWMAKIQSVYGEEQAAPESLDLMKKSYDGMLANLDVIEKQMEPVRQYLEACNQPQSFFDEFAGGGWPSIQLLDYFFRDWCGTEEAESIEKLFTGAIERFCRDRSSVAVLGSGAGGVVQRAAEFFGLTFGVELAIDTLLLSRELLNGGHFTLNYSLPTPNFPLAVKAVTIEGAAQKRSGIRLLSADVHQLPFRSASLSCVITNYLMDVIPNQKMVAAEIHRVLAPQGVWLDLSLPISMSAGDQFNSLDQVGFLKRAGFKLLDRDVHRYNFLDLTPVSEWAWTHNQTPVIFAAEKIPGAPPPRSNYFAEYFAGKTDTIWEKIPKRVVDISLVHDRRFTETGVEESKGLAVRHMNDHRPGHFAVSDQTTMLAEWFLRAIDGKRSVREIYELMRQTYGELIQPGDVIKFFNDLEVSSFVEI